MNVLTKQPTISGIEALDQIGESIKSGDIAKLVGVWAHPDDQLYSARSLRYLC